MVIFLKVLNIFDRIFSKMSDVSILEDPFTIFYNKFYFFELTVRLKNEKNENMNNFQVSSGNKKKKLLHQKISPFRSTNLRNK